VSDDEHEGGRRTPSGSKPNRFVAGETSDAAVAELNAGGLLATVDLLGEATRQEA
jgi:hypothetical protein